MGLKDISILGEGRCRAKSDEDGPYSKLTPFLACVSAGVVMDGVCCGCVAEGGSRLDMIERCDVAFDDLGVGDTTAEQVSARYDVVERLRGVGCRRNGRATAIDRADDRR